MAQLVNMMFMKNNEISSIPKTHMNVEGENWLQKEHPDLHPGTTCAHPYLPINPQTYNNDYKGFKDYK